MNKLGLALALIALTACQEISTSTSPMKPSSATAIELGFHPAPPPPTDTGAFTDGGAGVAIVNVTYLLNRPQTNGFLTFRNQTQPGVSATPNARVSYHKGVFSGTGILTIGTGFIDLSSVTQASHFGNAAEDYFNVTYAKSYQVVGNDTVFAGPAYSRVSPGCTINSDGCFVDGGIR